MMRRIDKSDVHDFSRACATFSGGFKARDADELKVLEKQLKTNFFERDVIFCVANTVVGINCLFLW